MHDLAVPVRHVVLEIGRHRAVPEEDHLARNRVDFRVGRHRTIQPACKIILPERHEFAGQLGWLAGLHQRQVAPPMPDEVGIGIAGLTEQSGEDPRDTHWA